MREGRSWERQEWKGVEPKAAGPELQQLETAKIRKSLSEKGKYP